MSNSKHCVFTEQEVKRAEKRRFAYKVAVLFALTLLFSFLLAPSITSVSSWFSDFINIVILGAAYTCFVVMLFYTSDGKLSFSDPEMKELTARELQELDDMLKRTPQDKDLDLKSTISKAVQDGKTLRKRDLDAVELLFKRCEKERMRRAEAKKKQETLNSLASESKKSEAKE